MHAHCDTGCNSDFPIACLGTSDEAKGRSLSVARAILTLGVAAKWRSSGLMAAAVGAGKAARVYSLSSESADIALASRSAYRATDTANKAGNFAQAAKTAHADSRVAFVATNPMILPDAFDAPAFSDLVTSETALFEKPVWENSFIETPCVGLAPYRPACLDHQSFAFWRDWYQGFLDGKPLDWELQRRVALIPDEDWEEGPEHIASLIEEIRQEFETPIGNENARHPDLEPNNVISLFENKQVVSASNFRLEADIGHAIEQYHSDTGLNQIPEMFEPIRALPKSLGKISAIVQNPNPDAETEQQLREEIGRLNAKIGALEAELTKAKNGGLTSEFKAQVGRSLGDWKLYAAIVGAVWLISGDQVGMKKRLENIQNMRNDLFGSESPYPQLEQHFQFQKEKH